MNGVQIQEENTIFSPTFQKQFTKLDPSTQFFLKEALEKIFQGKKTANIKQLRNYPLARYRLKIGHYRLLTGGRLSISSN